MMTRKTSAMLGLGALLLALLLGQIGSGQMPNPMSMGPQGPSPEMSPQMLDQEIELLVAINRMGLSPEQLKQLQQILDGLQAPQQVHRQHRQELRQFLLSWQGSPEQFEPALQNFRQERKQQLEQLKARNRDLIDRLKDVLTYRQGELLYRALRKLSRTPMGSMGSMGPMGGMNMGMGHGHAQAQAQQGMRPQPGMGMGMMPMMQQHMQMMHHMMPMMGQSGMMMGMGRMGTGPAASAPALEVLIEQHLELLQRVFAQKLQALQGQ